MPITSSRVTTRQPFVADRDSLVRDTGHTIDWANVASDGTYGVTGKRRIPAGTVMGELLSGNGQISPRIVTTNPATCILETDADEDNLVDARSGYGVLRGGHLYENLLPQATGTPRQLAAAVRTELAAAFVSDFVFSQYTDNTST